MLSSRINENKTIGLYSCSNSLLVTMQDYYVVFHNDASSQSIEIMINFRFKDLLLEHYYFS